MIHHSDYKKIVELLMISTRLLNDLQSYQKERKEGKNNPVLLFMERHPESKIEHAYTYVTETLDRTKKDLLEHALIDDKNCPKIMQEGSLDHSKDIPNVLQLYQSLQLSNSNDPGHQQSNLRTIVYVERL
ncbi:hypothetical protein AAC387_Pa12g1857 [Persea americana]